MNALTNEEKARLILSVGKGGAGGKRFLSPIQVAEYLDRCLKGGDTAQQLAESLRIGKDMISRFTSLLKLSTSAQSIVEFSASDTTLSFSVAHQISRLDDPQAQEELAKAALSYDLSKQDVIQVIQRKARSGNSVEDSVKAILALKPAIERRHVIIGSVTSTALKSSLTDTKSQEARDNWGRAAVANLFSGEYKYAIRITPERFTLTGPEGFFKEVMALKPDFETAINRSLGEHLHAI